MGSPRRSLKVLKTNMIMGEMNSQRGGPQDQAA
jgi:hypothetical protein